MPLLSNQGDKGNCFRWIAQQHENVYIPLNKGERQCITAFGSHLLNIKDVNKQQYISALSFADYTL